MEYLRRGTSLAEPGGAILQQSNLHEPGLKLTSAAAPQARPVVVPLPHHSGQAVTATLGPFGTAKRIVQREGFFALYKGLTAVWTGIVPKMAIRFVSFEQYKEILAPVMGASSYTVFLAGLASGLTEAVMVVTPAEVCKIRMQGQYNSMVDPVQMQHRKYTNVVQTAFTIVKEEGPGALYKGVVPTMMRQGINQAVNFTAYQYIKGKVMDYQGTTELQSWQSLMIGGTSGGMGPLVNNPLGKRTFCVLVTWYHKQREYLIHVLFALQMSSRRECRSKWFTLGKYQSILVLCRHAL